MSASRQLRIYILGVVDRPGKHHCELLPLTTLHMHDNSADADPTAGRTPRLKPVLHMERGKILGPPDLASTPNWAKPIVVAALKLHQS